MVPVDWRIRLGLAVVLITGAAALIYYGFTLRGLGQKFSHVWIMGLAAGWLGSVQLQRAFEAKGKS